MFRSIALVGIMTLAVAGPARAASIVINGGFETGNFSGWTSAGNNGFDGVTCGGGNCVGFFGAVGSTSTLSQNLATVPGLYQISFALQAFGDNPSSFSASFGGVALNSLTNPSTGGAFQQFNFLGTATGASTPLVFTFRDDPFFMFLDSVAVESVPSAVPEPASLILLGSGVAAAGLRRRKQRKA